MELIKQNFSKVSSEDALFGCIALTFLVLPIGTAPPLIGMGLACAVWLFSGRFLQVASVVKRPWFRPVILFAILPWIGLSYSQNLDLGMDYATKTQYWIAALVTAGCYMSERRLFIVVCALWAGLFAGAVLALIQFVGLAAPIKASFLGFGIVHTLVSMYLIIGILMVAFYFKRATSAGSKAGLLLLILAFIFHLTVLQGRSGYLIFVLISPLVARDLTHGLSVKIKVLVCAGLVFSLCLSPVVRNRVVDTFAIFNENKEKLMAGEPVQEMPRFFMARETLDVMKKHPLMGIGTGSLPEITRAHGHTLEHPHNNFLYMGVSFGIVGIISCFWLFWNMFARSWRARKTPVGYFVFSTCLVLFLGGMLDTQILNTGTLVMLCLVYGFLNHLKDEPKGTI